MKYLLLISSLIIALGVSAFATTSDGVKPVCEGHDNANWSVDSKEGPHRYNGTAMEYGEESDGSNHAIVIETTRSEFLNTDYAKIVQIKFIRTGRYQERAMVVLQTGSHYFIKVPIYKECGEYEPLTPIDPSLYKSNPDLIGTQTFAHMSRKDPQGRIHKN